ncbi:MAG: GDP-D-mannose 3',5'-epimerase [Candidatus Poriferisodalaceae bacterium]
MYRLAADMGAIGFIHSAETEIMRNSMLVNLNTVEAAARSSVTKYFFASSVCVYRDMKIGEPAIAEDAAYPALPDNEYGWEKLYSEQLAMAYSREFEVRIGRFHPEPAAASSLPNNLGS